MKTRFAVSYLAAASVLLVIGLRMMNAFDRRLLSLSDPTNAHIHHVSANFWPGFVIFAIAIAMMVDVLMTTGAYKVLGRAIHISWVIAYTLGEQVLVSVVRKLNAIHATGPHPAVADSPPYDPYV